MIDSSRSNRGDQTILGVAFDIEALGSEHAEHRAWQMWMERLDPAELHGIALYSGQLVMSGGRRVLIIAASGPAAAVSYVRSAFSAPDLAAFPGVLPAAQRLISGSDLPRERLALFGFVDEQGRLLARSHVPMLHELATHARWPLSPDRRAPAASRAVDQDETRQLKATQLEGATQMHLRIWTPSYRNHAAHHQRRILFAALGTLCILASIGIVAIRVLPHITRAGNPTTTQTQVPATAALTITPLALRVPCQLGSTEKFTLSDTGTEALTWTSDAAQYEPELAVSAVSGVIAPGNSQDVLLATGDPQTAMQQVIVTVQSNGGRVQITLTLGGC